MKAIVLIGIATVLSSCGSYRYYHPTTNSALFKNEGEIHIAGDIGTSGVSAKAAYAFPAHIGAIGSYSSGITNYKAQEIELGVGYYTHADPSGLFVLGGMGFGSNYEYSDSNQTHKLYQGDFLRPFIQLNNGITGGDLFWGLKGDLLYSLKLDYFMYKGHRFNTDMTSLKSEYLLLEPAVIMGLGARIFRFELSMGVPFRPALELLNASNKVRTFPITVGFGLRFMVGRDD